MAGRALDVCSKKKVPQCARKIVISRIHDACSKLYVITTFYNLLLTAEATAKLAKLPPARPATRQNEASVAATSLSSSLIRGLRFGDDDTIIQSDPRYLPYKLAMCFTFLRRQNEETYPLVMENKRMIKKYRMSESMNGALPTSRGVTLQAKKMGMNKERPRDRRRIRRGEVKRSAEYEGR